MRFCYKKNISAKADSGIPFLDIDTVSFVWIITENFIIAPFIKYKLTRKIYQRQTIRKYFVAI